LQQVLSTSVHHYVHHSVLHIVLAEHNAAASLHHAEEKKEKRVCTMHSNISSGCA